MKATEAVNKRMMDMIDKLLAESPLPATYLYKNDSQEKTLKALIEHGFVTEQRIPHSILRLISLTDKGIRLGELLGEIEQMFPPEETTTTSQDSEPVDEDEDEDAETTQATLEDIVNDG